MKLVVGIPSRGRACALTGVIMALERLKSGEHEIEYVVAIDQGDSRSHDAICALREPDGENIPAMALINQRTTLGKLWNVLTEETRGADIVTLLSDRAFCISPYWDDILADGVAKCPNRMLWWSSPQDPDPTMPVISKAWLEAANYEWCSPLWPFWFSDTENREIDLLLSGRQPLKVSAQYAGARGATTSGRDFAFWFSIYSALRPQRIEKAQRMAEAFGTTIKMPPEGFFEAWDKEMQDRSPDFEMQFGDKRPASDAYLRAKENATQFVKGLTDAG